MLYKCKYKIFRKIIKFIILQSAFLSLSGKASPQRCTLSSTENLKNEQELKNDGTYINVEAGKNFYVVIDNHAKMETIHEGNDKKIFDIEHILNANKRIENDTYYHFIFKKISEKNSSIEGKTSNDYQLMETETPGEYRISSERIESHEVLSIPIEIADPELINRKTIIINYINNNRTKSHKYVLNFRRITSPSRKRTHTTANLDFPKINEKIVDTSTQEGNEEYSKFRDALFELRTTIRDPEKTNMNNTTRELILKSLSTSQNVEPSRTIKRERISKKTISYAEYYNDQSQIPIKKYYSISGQNFKFLDSSDNVKVFVNFKEENRSLPSFNTAEKDQRSPERHNQKRAHEANQAKDSGLAEPKNSRFSDSEAKILESFLDQTKETGTQTTGGLKIFTSMRACASCQNAYKYFSKLRPNVNLEVFTLSDPDKENLYALVNK